MIFENFRFFEIVIIGNCPKPLVSGLIDINRKTCEVLDGKDWSN